MDKPWDAARPPVTAALLECEVGTDRGATSADVGWLRDLQERARRLDGDSGRLNAVAQAVADRFAAPSVRLWSLSPEVDCLRLRASVGLSLPFDGLQDRVPVRHSELGGVITGLAPFYVECVDASTPDEVRHWANQNGVATFAALPIVVAGEPWGVLALFTCAPLVREERLLLSRVTEQLGDVLAADSSDEPPSSPPELLSSLIPCLTSAVIALDERGLITRWSRRAEELFGWSEAEVLGRRLPIVPEDMRHEFDEWPTRIQHSRTFCQRADLSRIPVQRTTAPLFDRRGDVVGRLEVLTDDSPRVRSARCLQVQTLVMRILTGGRGLDDALLPLLTALGEWLDADVVEFWRPEEPGDSLARVGVWAKSCETRDRLAAVDLRLRIDSDAWPARAFRHDQVSYESDTAASHAAAVRPTEAALGIVVPGLAIPIRSGDARWGVVTCQGDTLHAPDELATATLHFVADALAQFLTRLRTEAELARSEANLRQTQKIDAIGLLAGGVAHDFNNLLTIILAYSEMGLAEVDQSSPLHECLTEIQGAGERAAAMTRKLLAVSRQQPARIVACNLNQLVNDMDRMLQRLLGPQITLVRECADNLALVQADVNQLEQVLLNLVVNARDALAQCGTITIATRNLVRTPQDARRLGTSAGEFVELSVRDTGCGMDDTTKARIFEPFFTTKAAGKGTGMGLATVFGIVQQCGGFVEVDSELNVGTTFSILLPRGREGLTTQVIDAQPMSSPIGTESVLVVDNDDAIRTLIRRLLEVRGYTVHEAARADQALALINGKRPAIDLVLADVPWHTAEGSALVQRLRGRSSPKLLPVSAHAEPPADLQLDDARQFLRKPFTSSQLAAQVRLVLDAELAK